MGYNEVAKILILTISVATATLAISLLSQSAVAATVICVGTTCAIAGGGEATAFDQGSLASTNTGPGQPGGATEGGTLASAGSNFCGGKPTAGNVLSGQITCAP
jgi:hypothetical protein